MLAANLCWSAALIYGVPKLLHENTAEISPIPHPIAQKLQALPNNRPTQVFRWSDLECSDYRTYMQNLRGVGCPEPTIFDIVTADVHALFQKQRQQTQKIDLCTLKSIAQQEAEVLHALGIQSGTIAVPQSTFEESGRNSDEADSRDQAAMAMAYQIFSTQRAMIIASIKDREPTEKELRTIEELEKAFEEQRKFLSPEEKEILDLEYSPSANSLRDALTRIEVSDEEFRALYSLRKKSDSAAGISKEEEEQVRQHVEEQFLQILGPERYDQYTGLSRDQDAPNESPKENNPTPDVPTS